MSDFFSDEILLEIFKRSAPKALLRCRSVCKAWKSLISTPTFIAEHIAAQKPHLILREFSETGPENYFRFRPQPFPAVDFCFRADRLQNLNIIGTANGVICLADNASGVARSIVLWNPLIQKYLHPPPPIDPPNSTSTLGFGSDPSRSDLKIIRIVSNSRQSLFGRTANHISTADLYSVRESTWRPIPIPIDPSPPLVLLHNRSQTFLHNSSHWSAFLKRSRSVLLSFRFETEQFKILDLPPELSRTQVHVSKIGDLLAAVKYRRAVRVVGSLGCDVWAMTVYGDVRSWCKMVSLRWDGGGLGRVMWVREDCGEMVVCGKDGEVAWCDGDGQSGARLVGVRCGGEGCFADGFVGSLAMLDCE